MDNREPFQELNWCQADVHDKFAVGVKPGGRFSVAVHIKEPAAAEKTFNALADGGKITMPIAETFWALRFGMLVDRFGIPWMVNCDKPM